MSFRTKPFLGSAPPPPPPPPPDEAVLEIGARATDAIPRPVPSRKVEAVTARSARALAARALSYSPHAALTACLFGAAWLVGSYFIGPAPTVVQQESVQSAEIGRAAEKKAVELHAQRADIEAMRAAQSLSTKDATGLGNTKPRDAAKAEISGAIAEVSGKVGHLRPKSAEKLPKVSARFDRIGLKIVALLAAAPLADRSASPAPVPRKRAQGGRGDAFDPSQNPNAPGAPRPLGAIAPAATANNSAAEYAYGQRTN